MSLQTGRYAAASPPSLAEGWSLERLTPASRLSGANGLRAGPDGRIYVAQVSGSRISALDVETGRLDTVSALGGAIVAPDDLAFDPSGNLYVTEVMDARVSRLAPDGGSHVLRSDLPSANGITFHRGRLFIDECRPDGRLIELDLDGGAPRVLAENLPMPNALAAGPDGLLYYPLMGANEIWRIDPDGGSPEKVAGDLGVPDAVKFDSNGYIVSTQVATGEVLRIDPRTGDRNVLAALDPGLDNLTFLGERLFVSHLTDGRITEILSGGETRTVLPGGLNWPLDLAIDGDGRLYVADGASLYAMQAGGGLQLVAMLFTPGYPGFVRGLALMPGGGLVVTTANGGVALYRPQEGTNEMLAEGLDQLYGVALAPDGAVLAAELGTGRLLSIRSGVVDVLAAGLDEPLGVAIGPDGACLVSESAGGRVARVTAAGSEPLLEGLRRPQGMVVHGGILYLVDAGAKSVIAFDLASRTQTVIATDLPVGAPRGVIPKPLRGFLPFCGPLGPFAGITAGSDGTLYVSADGEGSVLALRRSARRDAA